VRGGKKLVIAASREEEILDHGKFGGVKMRILRDVAFISSLLFTATLLCVVPWFWRAAQAGRDPGSIEGLDAGYRAAAHTMGDLGVACLAVISIGLVITWTGYVKRARPAWFVMFILVWVWAFPLLVLPVFQGTWVGRPTDWASAALRRPGFERAFAESVLLFMVMVIALTLPIKSFFWGKTRP
jgi:hypothetical protein